jgi:predicted site-specific integrase-resolvase
MDSGEALSAGEVILTEKEAAAWLRISPRTLARWRRTGGSPNYSKVSNRAVYRATDLDAFLNARRNQVTV